MACTCFVSHRDTWHQALCIAGWDTQLLPDCPPNGDPFLLVQPALLQDGVKKGTQGLCLPASCTAMELMRESVLATGARREFPWLGAGRLGGVWGRFLPV